MMTWCYFSNEHLVAYTAIDESVAAFMCNAIAMQIAKSSHKEVKDYFSANAVYPS